jgi:hypothetical protein
MNDYFIAEIISWTNRIGVCTDGAAALTGHKKGFQAEVRQIGFYATKGSESRELCKSSPTEPSLICSFVNAGRHKPFL